MIDAPPPGVVGQRAQRALVDPLQLTFESPELHGAGPARPLLTDGGADEPTLDDLHGEVVPARYYRPGRERPLETQADHRYAEGIYA